MSAQTIRVVGEVLDERAAQDLKWGQQDHNLPIWLAVLTEEVGEVAEAILKARGEGKRKTTATARAELVQVAAVAVAAIEYVDRHRGHEAKMLGLDPERELLHKYVADPGFRRAIDERAVELAAPK